MSTFTIDTDNNITAHAELPAGADASQSFSTEKQLAKLTADWPTSRLIEVWNSFAGVTPFDDLKPVKKFTDRKSAVSRMWKAVQRLAASVAPQSAPVAPEEASANKGASRKKGAPKGRKAAKAKEPRKPRAESKTAMILALIGRAEGATLGEIMKAADWQAHSVRGFISTAGKKHNVKIESSKNDKGERTYRIA